MTTKQTIAKKYAFAALALAKDNNLIDQFLIDLQKFSAIFSAAVSKELSNPTIPKSDLIIIIAELGQRLSLSDKVIDFLKVIATARRILFIKEIEQNFIRLAKKEKNIIEADVISAIQLNDELLQEVKIILQKKYINFTIEVTQTIKKDILGGLIIKIGSNMIDASLKKQILALKNELCFS
jgi:F-type H+-transporting ATPase subunit delta